MTKEEFENRAWRVSGLYEYHNDESTLIAIGRLMEECLRDLGYEKGLNVLCELFKDWRKNNQYYIPRELDAIKYKYPELPWLKACELYEDAVAASFTVFNTDENNIIDIIDDENNERLEYVAHLWQRLIEDYLGINNK